MPVKIVMAMVLVAIGFAAGVKVTNNARDAELYAIRQKHEQELIERGQEAANIIEEALNEQQKTRIEYRTKYIDKIRIVERTNKCRLDDDSLRLWQEAITNINAKASRSDAAMPAASPTQ